MVKLYSASIMNDQMNLLINPNVSDPILSYLKKASGINFDYYQSKFVERRIFHRMNSLNLSSYPDYYNYLTNNPNELKIFLNKFTINYTYFFRNYGIFERLHELLNVNRLNSKQRILIWSCPCASGEEPYSIAMFLDRMRKKYPKFPDFKIVASDIDKEAIDSARNGVYSEYALHETPKIFLENYFTRKDTDTGSLFTISDEIKEKVEFIEEDLIAGHKKDFNYDMIFCRNLLIYIEPNYRESLLRILEKHLKLGGLLILGMAESLFHVKCDFTSIDHKFRFFIKGYPYISELLNENIISKERLSQDYTKATPLNVNNSNQGSQMKTTKKVEKSVESPNPTKNIVRKSPPYPINTKLNEIKKIPTRTPQKEKKNHVIEFSLEEKIKILQKRENRIRERERELESRELEFEMQIKEFELQRQSLKHVRDDLEKKEIRIENYIETVKKRDKESRHRLSELKTKEKHLELKREQLIQKEQQIDKIISQIGVQVGQKLKNENKLKSLSNKITISAETDKNINKYEKSDIDRIVTPNSNGELVLPLGYYSLINLHDISDTAIKIRINGLGSGIALILKDEINNIYAMSHIGFPNSSASQNNYHQLFPHTFIDTSVDTLLNILIYNGAKKENITSIFLGGAKLFLDYDLTYQENVEELMKEINKFHIKVEYEDLGGISERSVIYNPLQRALFIKKGWENEFRRVY